MKRTALAVCLLIVLLSPLFSLLQSGVLLASAESSIPKPSTPEFTVRLAGYPYDVPPVTSADPYAGENVTYSGYHVDNKTVEVTIENQPFIPYTDSFGNSVNLYYNISLKEHYENNWTYYPHNTYQVDYLQASGSNYTVVSFNLTASFRDGYFGLSGLSGGIPAGGEVDFQVQALTGYYTYSREPLYPMDVYDVKFTGQSSDWSNTQTVTISTDNGFNWAEISLFAALGIIIALLVVIPLIRRRKTKK